MKKIFPSEFVFSVYSLLIAFIVIHGIYVTVIRPNAQVFLEQEKADIVMDSNHIKQRSVYVLLKDYEQEACFILMVWAFAILGYKYRTAYRQQKQLDQDFIGLPENANITVPDVSTISKRIGLLPEKMQEFLLPRILLNALDRFASTRNIQDASTVVHNLCEEESSRLESELSIIRYIAWAIPSIGFIGTVRGIGDALAQAHLAVDGDITLVTQSLGVAFNSTFIALIISIVLMFIIHQIQLTQERLVLDSFRYCDKWLIGRLEQEK